jgi:hypothetical protein
MGWWHRRGSVPTPVGWWQGWGSRVEVGCRQAEWGGGAGGWGRVLFYFLIPHNHQFQTGSDGVPHHLHLSWNTL